MLDQSKLSVQLSICRISHWWIEQTIYRTIALCPLGCVSKTSWVCGPHGHRTHTQARLTGLTKTAQTAGTRHCCEGASAAKQLSHAQHSNTQLTLFEHLHNYRLTIGLIITTFFFNVVSCLRPHARLAISLLTLSTSQHSARPGEGVDHHLPPPLSHLLLLRPGSKDFFGGRAYGDTVQGVRVWQNMLKRRSS